MLDKIRRAWIEWSDAGPEPPMRRPTVLQFPVNDICNSRCQMCHIWQRKRDHEITPEELDRVLADPLFRDVRNVGINGGEPTLRRDLGQLLDTMVRRLPRFSGLSLITNAIQPERVSSAVDALGRRCQDVGVAFDVMVSLDGIGAVHDRVRGVPGNFESSRIVIDHVLRSPLVHSRRIGCTIIAENVFDVENVLAFARDSGIYARFRLGIPHPRLYTAQVREPFALGAEARFHLAAFLDGLVQDYERDPVRRAFYRSLRSQLVYDRPRAAGCAWKNRGATLSSRGELSFCAVASPALGDATKQSASQLYWDGAPVLATIVRDSCSDCRHDYDGIGDRALLIRSWLHRLDGRLPVTISRTLRSIRRTVQACGEWRTLIRRPPAKKRHRPTTQNILLCGWYGTETLGDRAILAGVCRLLREERPGVQIDVASLEPYVTRETARTMPELGLRSVLSLTAAQQLAGTGEYTAVAIAGGPLMTPVRELLDLHALLRTARAARSRVAVLGCGIGPVGGEHARQRALSRIVRESDVCVVRDSASAELAVSVCGRRGPIEAACDPAFFWAALQPHESPPPPATRIIALALREWTPHEYAADLSASAARTLKDQVEHELRDMIRRLVQTPGVHVVPVCMHTMAVGGDDRMFYHRLLNGIAGDIEKVPWQRRPPHEELRRLSASHAVCAMRFHSVVFSLALQRPFLALDYTRGGKIAALLRDTNNADRLVRLEDFRGAAAAEFLLDNVARPSPLNVVDLSRSEAIYRRAVGQLFQ